MIINISVMNLLKNKIYSIISVPGLPLGFTDFNLISLFVRNELNWTKSNAGYNNIFHIQRHYKKTIYAMHGRDISSHSRAITAQLFEKQYPEIKKVTVTREIDSVFMAYDPAGQIYNTKGIFANSWFFYKLPLQLWVSLMSIVIIAVIILLTTTYQTLKAATRNPVEALRYE